MKSSIPLFSAALLLACGTSSDAATKSKGPDASSKKSQAERHIVRPGETLWSISRALHVSIGELMDFNHLDSSAIHDGQVLRVPQPHREQSPPAANVRDTYTVSKGETFRSIARDYGITVAQLEKANPRVNPDHPRTGTVLVISRPGQDHDERSHNDDAPSTRDAVHVVGERDTFYSIAKKNNVSLDALIAANPGVKPEKLHPGMKVNLPSARKKIAERNDDRDSLREPPRRGRDDGHDDSPRKKPSPEVVKASLKNPPKEEPNMHKGKDSSGEKPGTRRYTVSPGETLSSIAEAFEVSESRLREMNGLKSGGTLRPGTEINVPSLKFD